MTQSQADLRIAGFFLYKNRSIAKNIIYKQINRKFTLIKAEE
jgi:hypothetical protein